MRTQKSLAAIGLSLALLSGGLTTLAQEKRRERTERPTSEDERKARVERELILTQQGGEFSVRVPAPGDIEGLPFKNDTFVYLSTELSFDGGKLVKGAPYSGETVTESIQTLADGNRIVRKNTAQVYRDGEGRTRREFTLNMLGPWATQDEPPRTVSIHDPVAGVSYTLDARSRTAIKMPMGPFRVARNSGSATVTALPSGPVGGVSVFSSDGKPVNFKETKSTLSSRILQKGAAANASGVAREMVAVKIKVGASGAVESAEAIVGDNAALRAAAVEAAKQWRFKAGEAETGAITYNFDGRASVPGELVRIFELPKDASVKGAGATATTVLSFEPPNTQTESLGKQMIEGVEAEGTRTTRTIPAGEIGNEQPIQIVSERWYSPELQVVVMTRQSDPRSGETVYKLTNIVRGEPSASLFQVPSDYTVKEAHTFGAPPRTFRRSKMPAPPPEMQ